MEDPGRFHALFPEFQTYRYFSLGWLFLLQPCPLLSFDSWKIVYCSITTELCSMWLLTLKWILSKVENLFLQSHCLYFWCLCSYRYHAYIKHFYHRKFYRTHPQNSFHLFYVKHVNSTWQVSAINTSATTKGILPMWCCWTWQRNELHTVSLENKCKMYSDHS